eukprot:scaffold1200_cov383-Prasinococcus_capsulatus_cf.AAC.2
MVFGVVLYMRRRRRQALQDEEVTKDVKDEEAPSYESTLQDESAKQRVCKARGLNEVGIPSHAAHDQHIRPHDGGDLRESGVVGAGGAAQWEIEWDDIEFPEPLVVIGRGGSAEVLRGQWHGTDVAVKRLLGWEIDALSHDDSLMGRTDGRKGGDWAILEREMELLSKLRHPNLVLYLGASRKPPNVSIIMEYVPNGSLDALLYKSTIALTQSLRHHILLGIAKGLAYLHTQVSLNARSPLPPRVLSMGPHCNKQNPILIHRDLKPGNVLLGSGYEAKICDFGIARSLAHTKMSTVSNTVVGTPGYISPELLAGEKYNEKVDQVSRNTGGTEPCCEKAGYEVICLTHCHPGQWPFGLIVYEIVKRKRPYSPDRAPVEIFAAVMLRGEHPELDNPETEFNRVLVEIYEKCMQEDPDARPSMTYIVQRLTDAYGLITNYSSPSRLLPTAPLMPQ